MDKVNQAAEQAEARKTSPEGLMKRRAKIERNLDSLNAVMANKSDMAVVGAIDNNTQAILLLIDTLAASRSEPVGASTPSRASAVTTDPEKIASDMRAVGLQ